MPKPSSKPASMAPCESPGPVLIPDEDVGGATAEAVQDFDPGCSDAVYISYGFSLRQHFLLFSFHCVPPFNSCPPNPCSFLHNPLSFSVCLSFSPSLNWRVLVGSSICFSVSLPLSLRPLYLSLSLLTSLCRSRSFSQCLSISLYIALHLNISLSPLFLRPSVFLSQASLRPLSPSLSPSFFSLSLSIPPLVCPSPDPGVCVCVCVSVCTHVRECMHIK